MLVSRPQSKIDIPSCATQTQKSLSVVRVRDFVRSGDPIAEGRATLKEKEKGDMT